MSGNTIHVLHVEKDKINRAVFVSQVSKMGFTVESCSTLTEGDTQILESNDFDVVVIGFHPPEEGLTAIKIIRSHPDVKVNTVPIIIVSIDSHIDTARQCIDAGADLFTQKMKPVGFLKLEIISLVRMARRMKG